MHQTLQLAKMASTHGGMRRMLKRQLPIQKYIRMAVETGVYKSKDGKYDPRPKRGQRSRQPERGVPHDANEQFDYPIEYEILTLNPPPPMIPILPKKMRKEQEHATSFPTDRFVRSYLRRYDDRMRTAHPLTDAQREEQMYARILGLSSSSSKRKEEDGSGIGSDGDDGTDTAMGRKRAVLDHAYKFAIRQYEVLRAGEGDGMTEEESVKVVEDMLAAEAREERSNSRRLAREAAEWRKARDRAEREQGREGVQSPSAAAAAAGDARGKRAITDDSSPSSSSSSSSVVHASSIPSILAGKPRTIRAMTMWSRRLDAVPYDRWTVGAAAALDHWIAVDVLGMSESSWKSALRGDPGEDEEVMTGRVAEAAGSSDHHSEGVGVGNAARVRDIVAVRAALFPETVLFSGSRREGVDGGVNATVAADDEEDEVDATQRSIDELLASLGCFDDENEDVEAEKEKAEATAGSTKADAGKDALVGSERDDRVSDLMDELQEWRVKNEETPFEAWSASDRKDFNTWLNQYVSILTSEADGPVDLEATREALLSEPPLKREESDRFWSSLVDETEAEIFLQSLRERGVPPPTPGGGESALDAKAREDMRTFLSLPYERQLRKLVDMGTLRPILDEYVSESDRMAFLRRYASSFLEGVEIEHLVPDPAGPIRAEDVIGRRGKREDLGGFGILEEGEVKSGERFRIEMVKYGSDEYGGGAGERARALWRAWNAHKAGRAMYEEAMFKKGKIGLIDTSLTKKRKKN